MAAGLSARHAHRVEERTTCGAPSGCAAHPLPPAPTPCMPPRRSPPASGSNRINAPTLTLPPAYKQPPACVGPSPLPQIQGIHIIHQPPSHTSSRHPTPHSKTPTQPVPRRPISMAPHTRTPTPPVAAPPTTLLPLPAAHATSRCARPAAPAHPRAPPSAAAPPGRLAQRRRGGGLTGWAASCSEGCNGWSQKVPLGCKDR